MPPAPVMADRRALVCGRNTSLDPQEGTGTGRCMAANGEECSMVCVKEHDKVGRVLLAEGGPKKDGRKRGRQGKKKEMCDNPKSILAIFCVRERIDAE